MAYNNKPISPQQLAMMGRDGDTMLAHINPEEAEMLKRMGGRGTINPATGLPEFAFGDDTWGIVNQDGGDGGWDFGGGGYNDYYDYGGGNSVFEVDWSGGYNPSQLWGSVGDDNSSGTVGQDYGSGDNYDYGGGGNYTVDETGNYNYNDFVPPVVDNTPVDTGPVVPDITPVDTGPSAADILAQQQADAAAAEQQA